MLIQGMNKNGIEYSKKRYEKRKHSIPSVLKSIGRATEIERMNDSSKDLRPIFVISFNVMPMTAIRQLIDIFYDYFICFVIVKNQFRM